MQVSPGPRAHESSPGAPSPTLPSTPPRASGDDMISDTLSAISEPGKATHPHRVLTDQNSIFESVPENEHRRASGDDMVSDSPLSVVSDPENVTHPHQMLAGEKPLCESSPQKEPPDSNSKGAQNNSNDSRRHAPVVWLSPCLTLILLTLTALYAFRPGLWKSEFINSSQSNAIFVLRALSEATGFLLAITISSAFEMAQWLLTVRADGMAFTDYLVLQPGTGILGLMGSIVGRTKGQGQTTLWSILKLVTMILLPGLGILIMSNVDTTLKFDQVGQITAPLGFGLGPVDTSVAGRLAIFTDVLFGASFSQFLDDSTHAIDITPDASQRRSCALGIDVRGGQTCERVVYLAAGQEQLAEQITTNAHPQADSWYVVGHQGYVLHFAEGDQGHSWTFDNATECRTYYTEVQNTALGAYMMCVKNVAPNHVQARISSCQDADVITANCHKESSWNATPTWTTSLQTSYRQAKLGYSRLNGTILSHEFTSTPSEDRSASINASDILLAWDNFLGVANSTDVLTSTALSLLGLGPGKYLFPAMIGSMLNSISALAPKNPALGTRAVNALQALLTIPLYYCQTGFLEREAVSSLPSNILYVNYQNIVLPEGIERDSPVFFAVTRNEIVVGRATVISYVVLTGVLLALCFLSLCVGTCSTGSKRIPQITAFPTLDFCLHCVVTSKAGRVLTEGGHFHGLKTGGDGDIGTNQMRLKLAHSSKPPGEAGLPGRSA